MPGADAPKRSKPIDRPFGPIYLSQPRVIPASNEIFIAPRLGIIESLYSLDWASNNSQHGILTTLTLLSFINFDTSKARLTSEPVAKKINSGLSSSLIIYAPLETPLYTVFSSKLKIGIPCLVKSKAQGVLVCCKAILKDAAVSFASAGLKTLKFGMDLRAMACSTGW